MGGYLGGACSGLWMYDCYEAFRIDSVDRSGAYLSITNIAEADIHVAETLRARQ